MAPVTTPAPNKPSLRFNLNSDWGQVFVGDTFEYVITLQNVGDAAGGSSPLAGRARKPNIEKMQDIAPINDVVISDELNPLLEIVEATANGMKVSTDGQKVEAQRATLAGGELVTVKIKVRARAIDVSGKMVLNQASLTYKDEADRQFSNIVAVKIVTKDAPTATPAPTAVPTATTPPVEAKSATTEFVEQGTQELPKTSGGAPLGGVMLLGFTMLLRSVRLRRARTRI